MATSHRVHMGPMANEIRLKMGESPNVDQCWSLIRERVGQLLFGQAFATVPFITAADYFHQLAIFTKKRKFKDFMMRRPSAYTIVGNIDTLIDRNRSTWYPQYDFSAWDVTDGNSMYSDYRFRITSNPGNDMKMMEVVIKKPRIRSVQLSSNDAVAIDMTKLQGSESVRYVFLVTEVVLASYVHFLVRIKQEHKLVKFDRDIPIGFKYKKFQIATDGTFVREVSTDLKYSDREAQWVRPQILPVPRPPGIDRDKTERKNRTVLTVAANQENERRSRNPNMTVRTVVRAVQVPSGQEAMEVRRPPNALIRYIYRPQRPTNRYMSAIQSRLVLNHLQDIEEDDNELPDRIHIIEPTPSQESLD